MKIPISKLDDDDYDDDDDGGERVVYISSLSEAEKQSRAAYI